MPLRCNPVNRLLFFLRLFSLGTASILKWAACVATLWLTGVGVLALSAAVSPPNLPPVWGNRADCISREESIPHTREWFLRLSDKERWQRMQKALAILDIVCPDVSDWTRERWYTGHLVFDTHENGTLAWWMPAFRLLGVNLAALEQSDAELACTLAHEFRHSRQSLLLNVQKVFAQLCGVDSRYELVESEAYAFEDVVRRAIRGKR